MADAGPLPDVSRAEVLVSAIMEFLGSDRAPGMKGVREALEREVAAAGLRGLASLKAHLSADHGWGYYPPDPLARRIHHLLADIFLPDSVLVGGAHLAGLGAQPVAIFSNHLSYSDANLVEVLLRRGGAGDLANRLTAIAGPKVFISQQRRFSSLCFGTIKVPQSADVSSEEAAMTARDVARAARQSIDAAHERLASGDALLLFGEGTRSRTREMHPLLPGVARYLEVPGVQVLPAGIAGTDAFFPIGDSAVHPTRVIIRLGCPVPARALLAAAGRDRRLLVDAIGLAIGELLPQEYRGFYGDPAKMPEAHRVLVASRKQSEASRA